MKRNEEFISLFALQRIKGVGVKNLQKLLSTFGSAKKVYDLDSSTLNETIRNANIAKAIEEKSGWKEAEKELDFMQQHDIQFVVLNDELYPELLKNCPDAPSIVYYKGTPNWNKYTNISIVGTRSASSYGLQSTKELVEYLSQSNISIVSGLALGIDAQAHKSSIEHQRNTFAVLGHGLNQIYPRKNLHLAKEIIENDGALVSEYSTQDSFRKENFIQRNRIIAGMSSSTIIVQSKFGGGAMSTARFAFHYDRDLFALPGRTTDINSQGCNFLIKNMQAQLLIDPAEVLKWFDEVPARQKELFIDLSKEEEEIVNLLKINDKLQIDSISLELNKPTFALLPLLLELEFKEVIKALPGKYYSL